MRSLLAAVLLLSVSVPAFADEAWTTPRGNIVYVEDIGDIAHWSFAYQYGDDNLVLDIYLPGLPSTLNQRGTYEGYFLIQDSNECGSNEQSPNGWSSGTWGNITVVFDKPSFPSGFDIWAGLCLQPVDPESLHAEPM